MQTNFSNDQLGQPGVQEIENILRKCVHCGFCLPSCPTYNILGDERDSPRGRIYLIKDLVEKDGRNASSVAPHVDRCLSCLACKTVCPSGVDYQHYIDFARSYIDSRHKRPFLDRLFRWALANILPYPDRFRFSLIVALMVKPILQFIPFKAASALNLLPKAIPKRSILALPQIFYPEIGRRFRVALLTGCAQQVLRPSINHSTIRVLCKIGCEVVLVGGMNCCGAIVNHMGRREEALTLAKANINAWNDELEGNGLDAIIVNASGCGTEVKDYSNMFKDNPVWRDKAEKISSLSVDIAEFLDNIDLPNSTLKNLPTVVYHDACSLLHGQNIVDQPRSLLEKAGFTVKNIPGPHFCCGSAGTYNILQIEIAELLQSRRLEKIQETEGEIVATGNIGCQVQLQRGIDRPVVHTVELLDWATGGPRPSGNFYHDAQS